MLAKLQVLLMKAHEISAVCDLCSSALLAVQKKNDNCDQLFMRFNSPLMCHQRKHTAAVNK